MKRRTALTTTATTALALAALLLAPLGGSAQAQDLKDKTIRVVVPFPPGGTADNIARLITQQANTAGFKLIIENRPGAGTIIGTEQVARATADGSSLLIMSNSFVINTIVRTQLPYDPFALEPLCFIADSAQVIVVPQA